MMGTKEGLPQLPDGIFQKPQPMLCGETILQHGVEKTGTAFDSDARRSDSESGNNQYRAECHYCGTCGRGCDVGAMFNSPTGIARARERDRQSDASVRIP